MLRIGFLGPEGTFSHEALLKYTEELKSTGDPGYEAVAFSSIQDIILAVDGCVVDEAVVPIENSIEGAVNVTLDMMSSEELDVKIKKELVIPVQQNLLVRKGTKMKDITRVISHSQAIGQCRGYISKNLPDADVIVTNSTAWAAEETAAGPGDTAAIGSETAARVYGLEIIAGNIQDVINNYTRFIVLGKTDSPKTGNDRTSIVFSTGDSPGSLYKILGIFDLWDINLSRIESRPAKNQLGNYIFFVDVIGHREDEDIKEAFTMVKRKTSFFRLLGSYPVYRLQGAAGN